ncbi:SAP domain protein [Aspergillus sclerotialis]|uniref:SAP domain protein n=1 Tax=Aspergillus sclerotialis TaxID=2070753 RepID=A0A3A2ZGT2_9EURO|nr:SAP domain protein [Aspergillus sclerotialis]
MADYSSWKVTDLKAELKRRGIPQTGLRVKQNFVDRLLEEDAKQQPEAGGALEEPSREPDTEKAEQPEGDQGAQQGIPAEPVESQEPKPDEKQVQEQKKEDESVAQRDAAAEKQEEPKPAGEVEEQQVKETVDQQPPQEKEVEKVEEPPMPEGTAQPDTTGQVAEEPPAAPPAEPAEPAEPAITQEPAPAPTEAPDTTAPTEKVTPPVVSAPETSTELSTPLPTEEVLDDSRKRKRRSRSPVPTPDTITNKKVRARSGSPRVLLPEDTGAENIPQEKDLDTTVAPVSRESPEPHNRRPSGLDDVRGKRGALPKQGARFRELFAPVEQDSVRPASPPRDVKMEDTEVEPAIHPATAALYVDGLMRPLQPAALKNHLISLASAPGTSPNPDVILNFYLDPIKTHCFVSFANVSAASRTRSSLHGTVWPNERNRKTLFADFIPEHKVEQWIDTEENSRGRGGRPPRWEVKYDRTDGGIEAVLEEVDTRATANQATAREPATSRAPPTGPRASFDQGDRRPSDQAPTESHAQPGRGFQPLDDLFMSTTTKPKLYYLPVSREVADRRLDRFDDLIHKGGFPRRGGDETRRISFEDGDVFVDKGPEFLNRNRRGGRGRGGFWRESRRGRY